MRRLSDREYTSDAEQCTRCSDFAYKHHCPTKETALMSSSVDQLISIRILEEINRGLREEVAQRAIIDATLVKPLWYRVGMAPISLVAALLLGIQL